MLLVYGLFALLLACLAVRAPIPYVQDTILNLLHPYIVIAVAMTDITILLKQHNNVTLDALNYFKMLF